MRVHVVFTVGLLLLAASVNAEEEQSVDADTSPTNNAAMDRFIRATSDEVEGGDGQWMLTVGDRPVMVLTDELANRMRIMTPVADADSLDQRDLIVLMEANFDKALDARYALWQGTLWSVFIHPLGELSADRFDAGLLQTVTLADNYGTTYTSTDRTFGPGDPPDDPQPDSDRSGKGRTGPPPAPR